MRKFLNPSFAVALAALVVAMGGTALAAGEITGSDSPQNETTRLLPYGDNKITPFLTNVSFDVAAIC